MNGKTCNDSGWSKYTPTTKNKTKKFRENDDNIRVNVNIDPSFKVIPKRMAITLRNSESQDLVNAGVNDSGRPYHSRYISSPVTGSQPRVLKKNSAIGMTLSKFINTYALKPLEAIIVHLFSIESNCININNSQQPGLLPVIISLNRSLQRRL